MTIEKMMPTPNQHKQYEQHRPIAIAPKALSKRTRILALATLFLLGAGLFATQAAWAQTKPKKPTPAATQAAPAAPVAEAAAAGDPVLTNRATDMYKLADSDSPVVEKLSSKVQVNVVERKGKWHRVIAASKTTGWVNMMHLRGEVVVVASGAEPGVMSGLTGFLSGGSGGGSSKSQGATLGIRGFSAEDLQNAAPNFASLQKVRSFRSEGSEAERFAREVNLKKTDVQLIDSYGKPIAPKS